MKTIKEVAVSGKRILVRVDFNVPLDADTGAILNDYRLRASLPTIKHIIENRGRVILCSHLGRPKGRITPEFSLEPIANHLSNLLGRSVRMAPDCIGADVQAMSNLLADGDLMLLENLRYYPDEEENDRVFARELARLADIYVDDAFGVAHRAHASVVAITDFLPAVAGLLLEKEVNTLNGLFSDPARPFAALLGGGKVSDKITMLGRLLDHIDYLIVGGAMAATLLKVKGIPVGRSAYEDDRLDYAAELLRQSVQRGIQVVLPVDVVADGPAGTIITDINRIPAEGRIVDIGPRSIELFTQPLKKCHTAFWNGPMGIYETPDFAHGTLAMGRLLAGLRAKTIIGGGSTADAVIDMKLANKMSFVSTGGGAALAFLGGEKLPGVEALEAAPVAAL